VEGLLHFEGFGDLQFLVFNVSWVSMFDNHSEGFLLETHSVLAFLAWEYLGEDVRKTSETTLGLILLMIEPDNLEIIPYITVVNW